MLKGWNCCWNSRGWKGSCGSAPCNAYCPLCAGNVSAGTSGFGIICCLGFNQLGHLPSCLRLDRLRLCLDLDFGCGGVRTTFVPEINTLGMDPDGVVAIESMISRITSSKGEGGNGGVNWPLSIRGGVRITVAFGIDCFEGGVRKMVLEAGMNGATETNSERKVLVGLDIAAVDVEGTVSALVNRGGDCSTDG